MVQVNLEIPNLGDLFWCHGDIADHDHDEDNDDDENNEDDDDGEDDDEDEVDIWSDISTRSRLCQCVCPAGQTHPTKS